MPQGRNGMKCRAALALQEAHRCPCKGAPEARRAEYARDIIVPACAKLGDYEHGTAPFFMVLSGCSAGAETTRFPCLPDKNENAMTGTSE